jgi:hypothetical protein
VTFVKLTKGGGSDPQLLWATDGQCIDQGDHQYAGVRVDDTSVFFIRDGQILRLPR